MSELIQLDIETDDAIDLAEALCKLSEISKEIEALDVQSTIQYRPDADDVQHGHDAPAVA